jgi:hypothetical protein
MPVGGGGFVEVVEKLNVSIGAAYHECKMHVNFTKISRYSAPNITVLCTLGGVLEFLGYKYYAALPLKHFLAKKMYL